MDEGHVGFEVHRAARIAATAQGGQFRLSRATRGLLGTLRAVLDLASIGLKHPCYAQRSTS